MKKYNAVIFDLDGVICRTDHYHYLAWKELADRLEIPFTEEDNNFLRGVSREESLNIILNKGKEKYYTNEQKHVMADEKNSIYRHYLEKMTSADLPCDVKKTLYLLRDRKIKMAIGSSSKNTKLILNKIGLGSFFDVISDGMNIIRSKPDPEVFLKAAQMMSEKPGYCLVVEDAHAGIEAAVRGHFDSAGIGDAFGDERAIYHLQGFEDLLKIVY